MNGIRLIEDNGFIQNGLILERETDCKIAINKYHMSKTRRKKTLHSDNIAIFDRGDFADVKSEEDLRKFVKPYIGNKILYVRKEVSYVIE